MGCSELSKVTSTVITSRVEILRDLITENKPSIIALQETPDKTSDLLQNTGFSVYRSGTLLLGLLNSD